MTTNGITSYVVFFYILLFIFKYVPKEVALKNSNKISRLCVIILALMMCISGIVMPKVAEATDARDKTELIKTTIKGEVSQNGVPVTDKIDPAKPFDVNVNFSFPIIKNKMIGTPAAGGIDDKSKQVDDGDYADFTLGENFKATDTTGKSIPVRIKAQGDPDNGKQVGTITLSQEGTGPVKARMVFHSENFDFESDGKKVLTVYFEGHFQAQKQSSQTSGNEDRFIKVLEKPYYFPTSEKKITYDFTKVGQIDNPTTKKHINWTVNIKKSSNIGVVNLGGETFFDDLSKVGEYVPKSLKINDKEVNDNGIYDSTKKTLTYAFPEGFEGNSAKISFSTVVANPAEAKPVKNEAVLKIPNEDEKTAEYTVVVNPKVEIKKGFKSIGVNKETGEWEVIWTIIAGVPYENYGPAWVGDILSGELEGQAAPERVELTYSKSLSGEEGTWKDVDTSKIKTLSIDEAKDFPKFPEGENKACPDLSGYEGEVYNLGTGWHDPTRPIQKGDKYKPVQNNWFFFKELNGQYHVTVKLIYKPGTKIGPLKNDAEIHTCADKVYPKTPPVYSGEATISKKAEKNYEADVINQGLLHWNVGVDFNNVFPSDDRYVYECFYYGKKDDFDKEKDKLTAKGLIPEDDLKKMVKGKENETYFNFDQAYVAGSLESLQEDPLDAKVIPLLNAKNVQVGEIVKISGFSKTKKYSFELKTRAQNIINDIKGASGSYDFTYKNTAVLGVGSGKSFKAISAADQYELPGNLLSKFAMEYDANLDKMEDVSKNGWKSSWRDYITGIPEVDDSKTLNYKDRSILFRIDVNPQGLKLQDYISKLAGNKPKGDFTKLEVKDVLQEGLSLCPVKDGGPDYYIYKADPGTPGFIDHGGVTVAGGTPFVSFMPPGRATTKLNPQDANVSFDKDKMTWTFDKYDGTPYFIVIRTKVSEEFFNKLIKNAKQGEKISFTNHVDLKAGDKKLAATDGSASVNSYMLAKEVPRVEGDYLNWTFDYKPFDIKFKDVVIKDKLDPNISIPIDKDGNASFDNFTIERSNDMQHDGSYKDFKPVTKVKSNPKDGEVSVRYDVKDHCIYFDIPDTKAGETPYSYRFTYKTIIRLSDLNAEKIVNHVEMSAKDEKIGANGNSEIKTQDYAAFATIKSLPYFVIQKVDKNNKPLSGAVFQYKDRDGNVVNCLSDKDGMVYIVKLNAGETEIKEIKAPDGYLKTKQVTKINVTDKNEVNLLSPKDGKGNGRFDSPLKVENEKAKTVDINVTKKWVGDKPNERPESITVNLLKNGEPMEDMSLVLDQSNGWKGMFKGMPLTDGDGNPIKYTISENKVPGYTSKITGSPTEGFVITNTKPGKPNESGKPKGKDKKKSPATGDNGFGYGWTTIAIAAGFGLIYLKRRQRHSKIN